MKSFKQFTEADAGWQVVVHFATSSSPRTIATYPTKDAALRRAWEYLGADARDVFVQAPDGTRVEVK